MQCRKEERQNYEDQKKDKVEKWKDGRGHKERGRRKDTLFPTLLFTMSCRSYLSCQNMKLKKRHTDRLTTLTNKCIYILMSHLERKASLTLPFTTVPKYFTDDFV